MAKQTAITVRLLGGIGNQMFQYAAAWSLAQRQGSQLLLDIVDFSDFDDRNYDLHVFPNVTESFCSVEQHKMLISKSLLAKSLRAIKKSKVYNEPHHHLDPDFFSLSAPIYLNGYFQSESYFIKYADEIRNKFKWDENRLSSTTRSYYSKLKQGMAISVHFRRGDYVNDQKTNDVHGTCDLAYYRNAIAMVTNRFPDSHFFVFSDDIPWVKSVKVFERLEHTYVDKSEDMHDSEEMFLMSQCEHNIVANSSFSWWGAWLNNNSQKLVIAPKNWFRSTELNTKDVIPSSWLTI